MTLIIVLLLMVCLTALAFATRRRFGVLGLALCAGVILSQLATGDVSSVLKSADVPVEPLSYQTAARVFLVIVPALVLMFAGPRYTTKHAQIVGAVGFGLFATVLLLPPLTADLPISDEAVRPFLNFIANNTRWIVSVAVIAAIADTMHTHTKKPLDKKK